MLSEIGEKLAISNALMTKHIKKLEQATIDQIRKRNGKRLEKEVSSLKTDFININFPEKVFPEMNLTSLPVKIGHFTDFRAEASCGMATKDRLIGALDDPKSIFGTRTSRCQYYLVKQWILRVQNSETAKKWGKNRNAGNQHGDCF